MLFSCSVMPHSATPWTIAHQASLSFTISQSFLKLMSVVLVCHPTILFSVAPFSSCPQSFSASGSFPMSWLSTSGDQNIGALASASVLPKIGLISFRINWFDLAVQGTLKSLLQHHSSKASIIRHSAFFMVQLFHDYWKNHSLDYMDLCWQSNVSAFLYAV